MARKKKGPAGERQALKVDTFPDQRSQDPTARERQEPGQEVFPPDSVRGGLKRRPKVAPYDSSEPHDARRLCAWIASEEERGMHERCPRWQRTREPCWCRTPTDEEVDHGWRWRVIPPLRGEEEASQEINRLEQEEWQHSHEIYAKVRERTHWKSGGRS